MVGSAPVSATDSFPSRRRYSSQHLRSLGGRRLTRIRNLLRRPLAVARSRRVPSLGPSGVEGDGVSANHRVKTAAFSCCFHQNPNLNPNLKSLLGWGAPRGRSRSLIFKEKLARPERFE